MCLIPISKRLADVLYLIPLGRVQSVAVGATIETGYFATTYDDA